MPIPDEPSEATRLWKSVYPPEVVTRQRVEGLLLLLVLIVDVTLIILVCTYLEGKFRYLSLAFLAGVIGGLLHSFKWFYKTIPRGEWKWDKFWWRFLNPLVSGVMGGSIYVVFRAGTFVGEVAPIIAVEKEDYYAYGLGFLTGLFADNAMNKMRDIAHTLFGPTKPAEDIYNRK